MEDQINKSINKYNRERQRKKPRQKILRFLSCVVVFCTVYALIIPAITQEKKTYCGKEAHVHLDTCYTQTEESGTKKMICNPEETVVHTHDDSCYKEVVIERVVSTESENDGQNVHVHTEECYDEEQNLICELEETASVPEQIEETTEVIIEKELICELPEVSEHIHNDDCFETSEETTGSLILVCGHEEHSHELMCYSNPDADVETAKDWEADLPELTGVWADDIIAVAESQKGYEESTKNYIVESDGESTKGYTRYGEWYGDCYGDWCAMFASFCYHYAEVEGYPLDSNCQSWIGKLEKLGLYHKPEDYTPEKGDLIFFQWDSDAPADHVGIVAEVTEDTVKTIEGNSGDKVRNKTYKKTNDSILGYGKLVEIEENKLVYEDDEMIMKVGFEQDYVLPEGAVLEVNKITPEADETTYDNLAASVSEMTVDETTYVRKLDFYEPSILVEGNPQVIPSDTKAQFEITYKNSLYTEEELEAVSDVNVLAVNGPEEEQIAMGLNQGEDLVVEELTAQFKGQTEGVTAITFASEGLPVLAVAATGDLVEGDYWMRVDDLSDLEVGNTVLIVTAEGYAAVTAGTSGNNKTYVKPEQVLGNDNAKYYYIKKTDDKALTKNLQFTVESKSEAELKLKNLQSLEYLVPANNTIFSSSTDSNTVVFTKVDRDATDGVGAANAVPKVTWQINRELYYLGCNSGDMSSGSITGLTTDISTHKDMLIFKMVHTKLPIPGSFGTVTPPIPQPPNYDDDLYNIRVSGSKEDMTIMKDLPGLDVGYASDAATSNIETEFGKSTDDGKVLTDKSVIYGKDDYNAFTNYEDGTFGVTLSALGQVTSEKGELVPNIDVVIILDTSYSMLNPNKEYLQDGKIRMQWAMEALNSVLNQITENSNSRVGVVSFSDGAQTMLPLDYYTSSTDIFFNFKPHSGSYDHNRFETLYNITINDGVRSLSTNEKPTPFVMDIGNSRPNWEGTFTQVGIQEAGEVFLNATTTDANGQKRQPVFILISDGGPTLCSTNYRTPQSGPVYGNSGNYDGNYSTADSDFKTTNEAQQNNVFGINGYYTVLTAQYYKDIVGNHYGVVPRFASIGIAVSESSTADSRLHDNSYCRAVLCPTEERLTTAYNNGTNKAICGQQLVKLLNNSAEVGEVIRIPNHYNGFNTYTATYSAVPVLPNPYSKYDYADAYYDVNYTNLEERLLSYINSVQYYVRSWQHVVNPGTSVVIEDQIGRGMEVLTAPVLRFAGENYTSNAEPQVDGNSITYTYNYQVNHDDAYGNNIDANSRVSALKGKTENLIYDLATIQVTVTTIGEGLDAYQTVTMTIPEELVPIYYLETYGTFYYKELPIRLIFQVGLSEAGIADANSVVPGQEKVYYTNRWDDNNTTVSILTPDTSNNFDFNLNSEEKVGQTTDTIDTSFVSTQNADRIVKQELGNNGKLVIRKEPAQVTVVKKWSGTTTKPVTVYLLADGKVVEDETIQLPVDGRWTYTWTDLPKYKTDGTPIIYTVAEKYEPGYTSSILGPGTYGTKGWVRADALEMIAGDTSEHANEYVLISAETGKAEVGDALAANGEGFKWIDEVENAAKDSVNPTDSAAIWVAKGSGENIYLQNKASQKYMSIDWSLFGSIWIELSNEKGPVIFYDESDQLTPPYGKISVKGSRLYYFAGLRDNYTGKVEDAISNGYDFHLYKYVDNSYTIPEGTFEITNTSTTVQPLEFTIRKVSNTNQNLAGAVFDLYRVTSSENDYLIPGTTEHGAIVEAVITVPAGGKTVKIPNENATYYLVETKAPNSYDKLKQPIKIVVQGGQLRIEDPNAMTKLEGKVLSVVNYGAYALPETGGIGTTIFYIVGAVMVIGAVVVAVTRRRMDERDEE